jgi:hypothetical protein
VCGGGEGQGGGGAQATELGGRAVQQRVTMLQDCLCVWSVWSVWVGRAGINKAIVWGVSGCEPLGSMVKMLQDCLCACTTHMCVTGKGGGGRGEKWF